MKMKIFVAVIATSIAVSAQAATRRRKVKKHQNTEGAHEMPVAA